MDVPSPWLHAALVEDLIQVRAHPADAATTDREVRALADVAAL